MDNTILPAAGGAPAGAPSGESVASPIGGGPAPVVAAPVGAAQQVPLFGGFRGGRRRKDGLAPGSPEALAADREKDRLRKERVRVKLAAVPAPLPSAAPGAPGPGPEVGGGPDDGSGFDAASPVPWDSSSLAPLFSQIIPAAESLATGQIVSRAIKAKLPAQAVREIEAECKWAEPAKKALEIEGPRLAAKWLNKTGVSAENQPEVVCLSALAVIGVSHFKLLQRLDKLVALANVGGSSVSPGARPPAVPAAAGPAASTGTGAAPGVAVPAGGGAP